MASITLPDLTAAQRELFAILDEFFIRATGENYKEFAAGGRFDDRVRSEADNLLKRRPDAFGWAARRLIDYYQRMQGDQFEAAREQGGVKLVLGGGGKFLPAHLASIRKMLLYCDTVLTPDPIMPWLERDRSEERFKDVWLLKTAFNLLTLKPLIDAEGLPYPAVIVFPSFEKTLEDNDPITLEGIRQLTLAAFSKAIGRKWESWDEFIRYVPANADSFLADVERSKLFVPPHGEVGAPISECIQKFRQEIQIWASSSHSKLIGELSDAQIVATAVMERMGPQFHLFENAKELAAQPMLVSPQQWHYYQHCVSLFDESLLSHAHIQPHTLATLRSLDTSKLEWLGNVPIEALVALRQKNENEEFRRKLDGFTKILAEPSLDNLDRVAAEVSRGIASIISDHKKTARAIEDKYQSKFKQTMMGSWLTLGAMFVPALCAFMSTTALGLNAFRLANSYVWDKSAQFAERDKLAKSLMGVLATAQTKAK